MQKVDIRVPMGTMFTLVGAILAGYGGLSYGSADYARSLDINVNLWWGSIILLFGVSLLGLAWRAGKLIPTAPAVPPPTRRE